MNWLPQYTTGSTTKTIYNVQSATSLVAVEHGAVQYNTQIARGHSGGGTERDGDNFGRIGSVVRSAPYVFCCLACFIMSDRGIVGLMVNKRR